MENENVQQRSVNEYTYLISQQILMEVSIRNLEEGALSPLDHMTEAQLNGFHETIQDCLVYLGEIQEVCQEVEYVNTLLVEQIDLLDELEQRVLMKLDSDGDYQG